MSDRSDIFINKDADIKSFKNIESSRKDIFALLVKDFFKIIIFKKVVPFNKVSSNAQIFSSHLVNKIKDS